MYNPSLLFLSSERTSLVSLDDFSLSFIVLILIVRSKDEKTVESPRVEMGQAILE